MVLAVATGLYAVSTVKSQDLFLLMAALQINHALNFTSVSLQAKREHFDHLLYLLGSHVDIFSLFSYAFMCRVSSNHNEIVNGSFSFIDFKARKDHFNHFV